MAEFKDRLEKIRVTNKLSQTQLADIVGVSKQMINKYLLGKTKPNLDGMIQIAERLAVSLDWLAGLSDQKEPVKPGERPKINTMLDAMDMLKEIASKFGDEGKATPLHVVQRIATDSDGTQRVYHVIGFHACGYMELAVFKQIEMERNKDDIIDLIGKDNFDKLIEMNRAEYACVKPYEVDEGIQSIEIDDDAAEIKAHREWLMSIEGKPKEDQTNG